MATAYERGTPRGGSQAANASLQQQVDTFVSCELLLINRLYTLM